MSVDFPAPFSPARPRMAPRSTASETASSARVAPNLFDMASTRRK